MNNTVITMKKTKSIKIFFIAPLFALALTGCKKADDVPNALEEMAKHQNTIEAMASQVNLPSNSAKAQQKQTTQPSLPTPEILGFPYPAFAEPYVQALSSQKELPTNEQTAVVSQLAGKETTTFYFDKNYQLMSSPQNNGYYRKILGKNKNGHMEIVSFYSILKIHKHLKLHPSHLPLREISVVLITMGILTASLLVLVKMEI